MKPLSNKNFLLYLILIISLRFLHFGAEIDLPHDWRQSDTAHYIYDFYKNGIDFLRPSVCWMGNQDHVLFEFPLPEAIVAFAYQLFGESIPIARFIFLFFFAVALYYFYKIVDLLFEQEIAQWSTLIYALSPLSIFYSRAIHIDFSAMLCAHAMFYYFLLAIRKEQFSLLLLSSIFAAFGFVIKSPYLFYFSLPMAYFAFKEKRFLWLLQYSLVYAIPIVCFLFWQRHVYAMNSMSPDWDFILHYRKFDNNTGWYFGTLSSRLSLYSWWVLFQRGTLEVLGLGTVPLFLAGLFSVFMKKNNLVLWLWTIGVGIYLLIFFNLNFIHNYYQIPWIAPVAIFAAFGVQKLFEANFRFSLLTVILLLSSNVFLSEYLYFDLPENEIFIAKVTQEFVPEDELVIITYGELDCRNPRILYRARRKGWSIEELALNDSVIEKLIDENAAYWVYALPKSDQSANRKILDKYKEVKRVEYDNLEIFIVSLK